MYQSDLSTDIRNYLKQEITKLSEGQMNYKIVRMTTCHCSVMPLQLRCRNQEAAGNHCQQFQLPRAPNDHKGEHEVMRRRLCQPPSLTEEGCPWPLLCLPNFICMHLIGRA